MKAITIKQPFLHAILREGKDIENRTWKRDFRGWLALHAAGTPRRDVRFPRGVRMPDLAELDYSAVCAVAYVEEIITTSRSKWFDHRDDGRTNYGWVLTKVKVLKKPIRCKGTLHLWDLPPRVFRKLQSQLPRLRFDR